VEFRWNNWNIEHIARHGVRPEDAEDVILEAETPYPQYHGDGKWLVWGRNSSRGILQVVYILDEDDTVFVIHARPLTEREKRRYRRKQR
jgi:uncharacterized DUF497 family protein